MMNANVPLAVALTSLRAELREATDAANPSLAPEVPEIELELTVQVSRDPSGSAGMNLWSVVAEKGNPKENKAELHRLRIVLKPVSRDSQGHKLSLEI